MQYTRIFTQLKNLFNLDAQRTTIPNSTTEIQTFSFSSQPQQTSSTWQQKSSDLWPVEDKYINQNNSFVYPVFVPSDKTRYKKAIIMLHGLNERTWEKYLPWAHYLSEKTHRPIILFPIAFHMNRAPEQWSNPRKMLPLVKQQKRKFTDIPNSTFVNIALSKRLINDPRRFFISGHQSSLDIIKLITSIKEGDHPLFSEDCEIDFFSYSIGAFLSQILFIANPNNLLDSSRLFMFCGGSVFSRMDGSSRLIMDNKAFEKLIEYYVRDLDKNFSIKSAESASLRDYSIVKAFRSMLTQETLKSYRQDELFKCRNRIHALALAQDKVIPSQAVKETMSGWNSSMNSTFEELDFDYQYTHESPFPVTNTQIGPTVNNSFRKVFDKAAQFLL